MADGNDGVWLRLQASFFLDPKIVRAGPYGALVFLAALTKAKAAGYRKGHLPKDDLAPDILSRFLGLPEDVTVTAVTKCVSLGLLDETETDYAIRNWHKYQKDPGVTERVRNHRARKAGLVTDVTVGNGCNGDGTGHYGTLRDTTTTEVVAPPPQPVKVSQSPVNGSPEGSNGSGRFMDSSPLLKPGVAQVFDLRGVRFRELPGSLNAWGREVNALHSAGVSADELAGWLLIPENRVKAPWDLRERFRPARKKDGNGFVMSDAEAREAVKRLRSEGKIK